MVPVLKKLKVWSLYVHIVAQINHRGLGVKVMMMIWVFR